MAGNTRFHSKYHYAQHHSAVSLKNSIYPDASTDPIASFELPFQGDFFSDGVLKITSVDPTAFNYFGNDVFIDRDLYVTNNTSISGDLEVVGNVVLKANPKYDNPQRITIGDDKAGPLSAIDLVHFASYVDSDFSPDASHEHSLGEPDRRWDYLYVSNLNLNGSFKVGSCAKDGEGVDRGLYVDLMSNTVDPIQTWLPGRARMGVNTCTPNRELDLNGSMDVHGNIKMDNNRYVFWDSLSAGAGLEGNDTAYQHTKACGISGDASRLTIQHPDIIDLNAPEINTQAYDVNVVLKNSQDAMTLGSCLIHLDELNDRVGIHNCAPRTGLDITSDVLIEGYNFNANTHQTLLSGAYVDIDTSYVTKIKSPTTIVEGARTFINNNQYVKINTPEIDMSDQSTNVILDSRTLNFENCMLVLKGETKHTGINVCDPQHPLDVDGVANFRGPIRSQNATIDETINDNQVIYKDDITKAHTTTLGFYYDGIRAGIGHLPLSGEDARLYVGNGPIKLASKPGNVLTVDSSKEVAIDPSTTLVLDSTVFTSPDDHNIVFDLSNENENSCFAIRTSDELVDDVYSGDASTARFIVKPQASRDRAFFGLNTTDNIVVDDSSGKVDAYDVIMDADVNVTNGLRTGNWLHVEDDATIDGKVVVNSEEETAGIVVNSGRIDLVENIGGTDYALEFGSRTNLTELRSTAEIPGTASSHGSTISSATNDHMVIDLRNTDQDQRFAVRYSSDNSGISDKIVISAGHYIYQIPNPGYDDNEPVSLTNPQFIDETRQGHVGVNCIPTQDYHLDVNGNMRITGDFFVDGASTTIAAANMSVQDKNIVLNDGGTTASSNNAGIFIEGDSDTIVGYWKVHPTDIDKLVAKAPTGQEIMLDINGTGTSSLTMHDADLDLKNASFDITSSDDTTPATFNLQYTGSTVNQRLAVAASVNIVDSAIAMTNSTLTMEEDLTVSGESIINQDLTTGSTAAQFTGLSLADDLNIPVGSGKGSKFNGNIRFNTTSGAYEGYIESSASTGNWIPFNGLLADADGDTYITPEKSADSDQLEFYTTDKLAMKITKTQGVDIGSLLLNGTAITATGAELNMSDITTVGQSENDKVLTQSANGTIKIGVANDNTTIDIASHDGTDGGLKLNGTIVTSTAAQLNYVDVVKGTAAASKALVTDKIKSIGGLNVVKCVDLKASGEVHSSSTSDERLKTNLKRISKPIKKLKKISGYTFEWDTDVAVISELAGADVGVVAQEVEEILPEAVVTKESGFKGVKYEKLIPLLIECIKDQQSQIDQLNQKIDNM
jgi:hypothetical protein